MSVDPRAFTNRPGHCFRMVESSNPRRKGQSMNCPQPVAFRGRFQLGANVYEVEAYEGHADDLEDAVPIGIRGNGRG